MGPQSPRLSDVAMWPAQGRPVEYAALQIRTLLRQGHASDSGWYWAINPYRGCEYACTFCDVRLGAKDHEAWRAFERRIGVKSNAVEVLVRELTRPEVAGRPIVVGTTTEPWQQVEDQARLTRAILEGLARAAQGLDLRVNTRSSLIARDTDVLRELSKGGRVTVAFSLASIDERINRLMEPHAPSALRRFSAMEALSRAGIDVGVRVSPVLPGLDEEELGFEALLSRAAHAGARFAAMEPLHFLPGQRDAFLGHVDKEYPELSTRFRRVIGRRPPSAEELARTRSQFERCCDAYGLRPLSEAAAPRPAEPVEARAPEQMSLFM